MKDLGYYLGELDSFFGKKIEFVVIEFKKDYFGVIIDNVIVEFIIWKKLWGDIFFVFFVLLFKINRNYLLLIKMNCKDRYGCYIFNLDYFKSGKL